MKKIFLLMLAGLCLSACGDENETPPAPVIEPADYAGFRGQLTVAPNPGSPFQPFTEQEVEFRVFRESDTQISIMIPKIKFVKEIPSTSPSSCATCTTPPRPIRSSSSSP